MSTRASGRTCPLCSKPIRARDGVQFQHGDLLHVRCARQRNQVLAMEVRETAGEQRASGLVAASTKRAPLAGLTVLLVEDDADSRDALRLMLQSEGARVRVARDGPEALEALATGVPDVVLADVRMPGMDGCELARRVRAIPALARVGLIAVSGVTEPASKAVARAAGFDDYVVKPIDGDALIQTLQERLPTPRRSTRRKLA